jgi:hypothetical protein
LIGRLEQDVASEKPSLWCPKNGILTGEKNDILMEEKIKLTRAAKTIN